MPFFATALVDLLFIEFPGIHLSHEIRVQLDPLRHLSLKRPNIEFDSTYFMLLKDTWILRRNTKRR